MFLANERNNLPKHTKTKYPLILLSLVGLGLFAPIMVNGDGDKRPAANTVPTEAIEAVQAEVKTLKNESLEQSLDNVITNSQQYFGYESGSSSGGDTLHRMLAARRAVKIIQTVESMSAADREPACRRIFAQAFTKHTNTIASAIRMWEDPSAPSNTQSMLSTHEAVSMAIFLAADLGLRSLVAEEFRDIDRFCDTVVSNHSQLTEFQIHVAESYALPDRHFQLNVIRMAASHDAKLNSMVTNVIEEALKAKRLRTFGQVWVSAWDADDLTWFEQLRMSHVVSKETSAPKGAKTYEFLDWGNILEFSPDPQKAFVQQLKELYFPK